MGAGECHQAYKERNFIHQQNPGRQGRMYDIFKACYRVVGKNNYFIILKRPQKFYTLHFTFFSKLEVIVAAVSKSI